MRPPAPVSVWGHQVLPTYGQRPSLFIFTDHKPLTYAYTNGEIHARHEFIEQFCTDFRHVSGQDSVVADALSRAYTVTTPLDYNAFTSSQDHDAELQFVPKNGSALRLERMHIPGTDVNIYWDTSIPQPRPCITTTFRRQVFDTLHGLSHQGANVTVKLMSQRFVQAGVGKTAALGHTLVQNVNFPWYRGMWKPLSGISTSRRHVSLMCTSTWSGLCLSPPASGTVSLPSTDTHVDLRHPLCLTFPLMQLLSPSSFSGLLVSAAPSKSQPTRAGSSRPAFSRLLLLSPDPL